VARGKWAVKSAASVRQSATGSCRAESDRMTIPSDGSQSNAHPGGATLSIWQDTVDLPRFPKLTRSGSTQVCVVGAGIAGMTTAYLLAREGRKVVVLDDGPIAGGETGRTTAHLTYAMDDRIHWL
jgi:hypothetical protein